MSRVNDEPVGAETLISTLLRTGVVLSISIILAGLAFTFFHHPEYFRSRPALGALIDPHGEYTDRVGEAVRGAMKLQGQSIVMLGLLVLIATPVLRVFVSIFIFASRRDFLYVAITSVVFILLVIGFLLGVAG